MSPLFHAQAGGLSKYHFKTFSPRIVIIIFHGSNHLMVSNCHLPPSLLQQPLGIELVVEGVGA